MAADVYARVGAAIRSRRDGVGMTQTKLADATGLKRTSITNIESGAQTIMLHQIIDLAQALGTNVGQLISDAEAVRTEVNSAHTQNPLATKLLERLDRTHRINVK